MVGKIFEVVVRLAKGFFLAVGMIVVALVWWLSSGNSTAKSSGNEVKNSVVEVQAVDVKKEAIKESCACGEAVCQGQRGGRYCIKQDGSKRYVAQTQ